MAGFLKKAEKKVEAEEASIAPPNPITEFRAPSEFVPYYSHFNPHTLLTKNGELMQVIKITTNLKGLEYENTTDELSIVREAVRKSLLEHVKTDKIAIWLHTMRKRRPIRYKGEFKEEFAQQVQERWQHKNNWKYQYYNEIYITLLYDGQSALLTDTKDIKHLIFPKSNRNFRNAYLDTAYEDLERTVLDVIGAIRQTYNAARLTLVERIPLEADGMKQAIFYSEPMEFIGNLINLREEQFPLPESDISDALFTSKLTFGFNAIETKNEAGKRRFSSILTLKQYREVPSETIDRLLQAPMEFIITQAFHFIPPSGALTEYKAQKEFFEISGDLYCIAASGINDMMSVKVDKATDFGEHQTSIMVLSDEFKFLDREVVKIQNAFADLGLITIREDIKLEECYWSQLPGNFEFIRRKDTLNTMRIGGFCRLNRYPNGTPSDNHWGEAVTILPTQVGSPYFFNFHSQDNGHTAIIDFNSFTDQVSSILLNFFLCQTRKFDTKLYVFDQHRSSELLFQKLGGQYHYFPVLHRDSEDAPLRLNPFQLPDSPRNRSFLLAWIGLLIAPDFVLPDSQKELLKQAIDQLFSADAADRNMALLVRIVSELNPAIGGAFAKWHGEGPYAGIFDASQEELDMEQLLHAFDMSKVTKSKDCVVPIFAYLLHRIIADIDGRPTVIVIHEAALLMDNHFIAPRLESLMDMLKQNNALMIFTTTKPKHFLQTTISEVIMNNVASALIIPDDINHDYALPTLQLNAYDSKQLLKMDRQKGDFLFKHNKESIALRADVKELDEFHAVFANDMKSLSAALGKFTQEKANH